MVDVIKLQNKIIENPDYIHQILEELGHTYIRDKGNYFVCRNIDGDNDTAVSILKDTLHYENFSHGSSGSIITLVEEELGLNFKDALKWIAKTLGLSDVKSVNKKIILPFGGFYKQISSNDSENIEIPVYGEEILPPADCLSYMWLVKDHVDLVTQERFGIRVDLDSNRIVIPVRNTVGGLVGAKARANDSNVPLDRRWSMYKPYRKSMVLYGFNENYNDIIFKSTVVVVEAEKSVLQAISFGFNLCTGIGGHNISETQANYIKGFFADRIILAFDSGLREEEIRFEAEKLAKGNRLYKPKIGYIYDREGSVLRPKYKESPTDRGLEVFKILMRKPFLHWL